MSDSPIEDITDTPEEQAKRAQEKLETPKLAFRPIAQVANKETEVKPATSDVPWWAPWAAGGVAAALQAVGAALLAVPGAQIAGIIVTGVAVGAGVLAGVASRGRGNPS